MKRRFLPLFAAVALTAATLSTLSSPATAAVPGAKHVVVFGLDGARWDKINQTDTPTLKGLIDTGYSSSTLLYANPLAPTLSGPGWTTNLTGTWPDKHKVKDNAFTGHQIAANPSFLNVVEANNSAFKTYGGVDWKPIGDYILTGGLDREYVLNGDSDGYGVDDPKVETDAANWIKANGPEASFVYFGEVDIAGHNSGGASTAYKQAMQRSDAHVAAVINAIKSRPTYAAEEWLFMVTADHGHTDAGGHGGSSVLERTSFVIASGPGIPHTTPAVKPRNVDIAATALDYLGVPKPAQLDGRSILTASTDPFDTVRPSLAARVDETGIPASVLGWTKTTPSGWSISNSGLGTGGVTEWRGWTFTDDEFWTYAQRDQDRENFVKGRGVFAVADPDEWDDKTRSGPFNSYLNAPAVSVAGKTQVKVAYLSHYLAEGDQRGRLYVKFDGGADQLVKEYSADSKNATETYTVAVPAGAQNVTVKWALVNAGNNWYWAVDEPKITTS